MSALTSAPESTLQRRISVGGLTAPVPDIFLLFCLFQPLDLHNYETYAIFARRPG